MIDQSALLFIAEARASATSTSVTDADLRRLVNRLAACLEAHAFALADARQQGQQVAEMSLDDQAKQATADFRLLMKLDPEYVARARGLFGM